MRKTVNQKIVRQESHLFSPEGEMTLVEVSEFGTGVTIMIGPNRYDLDLDSAIDLADILLEVTNEVRSTNEF